MATRKSRFYKSLAADCSHSSCPSPQQFMRKVFLKDQLRGSEGTNFFNPVVARQSAKYYYCYGGIGLTAAWPSEATRRGVSNLIVDEIGSADVMAGFCDDGCETDATVPMPSLQASLNPDVTGMDLNCIAKRPQWGVRTSYCTTSHCEKVR